MQLQKASRKRAKIKMALQGPSGSGKTMGALLLAFGLCGDWSKIAVIDTENHSAELYADLGSFYTISLSAPFTPEKYIEAISLCQSTGKEVIILDSCSHEWEGSGGILDIHGNMTGNSFTNWSKLTPRHNGFIQAILQSPCHIIGTIRSKQEYVLQEKNGRMIPEKVGLKAVTREGMDYEFTVVFEIDIKHKVTVSKDRTGLFTDKPEFTISSTTGKLIAEWCSIGSESNDVKPSLSNRIDECETIDELLQLYKFQIPQIQKDFIDDFSAKRTKLENKILSLQKHSANGQQ